jgi:hypothetical protein
MGSLPFLLSKKESRIFFRQTPKKTPRNTDNARASSPAPAVRPELGSRFRRRGRRLWVFALSAGGASGGAAVFGAPASGRPVGAPASGRPNGRRPPAGQMGAGLRPAKWAPVSGRQNGRRSPARQNGRGAKRGASAGAFGPAALFFARKYKAFFVAGPQAIGLQFFMVLELGRWLFFGAVFL